MEVRIVSVPTHIVRFSKSKRNHVRVSFVSVFPQVFLHESTLFKIPAEKVNTVLRDTCVTGGLCLQQVDSGASGERSCELHTSIWMGSPISTVTWLQRRE